MKVITKGKATWNKQVTCSGCAAVLEVESSDITYSIPDSLAAAQQYNEEIRGIFTATCPECEFVITIKNIPPVEQRKIQNYNA